MTDIQNFIQNKGYVVMPGGMGTELQRRGYQTKLPLWSATANEDAFDLVVEIHSDYLKAGADICVTNTFRTTPRAYEKAGTPEKARHAMSESVRAARTAQESVHRPTFVAGSFTTLEDCYEPDLVPPEEDMRREHFQLVEWLCEDQVDFLLPETINSLKEAKVMAEAASQSGKPFFISFLSDKDGKLLDGNTLEEAIAITDLPGRFGVSLNCRSIEIMDQAFSKLCDLYSGIKGVYPNGIGCPHDDLGWVFEENQDSIERFTSYLLDWRTKGAQIIGGCCGTTPPYIEALSAEIGTKGSCVTCIHPFDIIETSGKAYIKAWEERRYLLRLALVPMLSKALCAAAVIIMGFEGKIFSQTLVMLPAYFFEGWLIVHIARLIFFDERWPLKLSGNTEQDILYLSERSRAVFSGIILYVLTYMAFYAALGFVTMSLPFEEGQAPKEMPEPSLAIFLVAIIVILGIVWLFKFFFLYLPIAIDASITSYLKMLPGLQSSLFLIGMYLISCVPFVLLTDFLKQIIGAILLSKPDLFLLFSSMLQIFMYTCAMCVITICFTMILKQLFSKNNQQDSQ